jgi:hypothetical protein
MNGKFTHYLITRYNVRLDQWGKDVHGQPTLKDDWMSHRFALFSRYCLPSVIAQVNLDFTWLIYFESSTTLLDLQQIRNLVEPYPFIRIRLVSGYFECMKDIDAELSSTQTPYVITSRLDNDDAISAEYIRAVQSYFVPVDRTLINMLSGYGYIPHQQVVTRLLNIQRNSFSSFIEERRAEGGHITVRGFPHGTPPEGTTIINVDKGYYWLKIFHQRNLLSKPFGYPVFRNHFSTEFGISQKDLALNWVSSVHYSLTWAVDGLFRKIKKILNVFKRTRVI